MNPEEKLHYENMIKEEIEKRMQGEEESHPLRNEMFSAGGGLAGAAAGIGSINAIDTFKEQRSLKHADKVNTERQVLRMLKDIHDGRKTWSDVAPEAEPVLREMYKENIDLLKDNSKYNAMMNNFGPQKVHRLHPEMNESKAAILKRALPNGKLFDNFAQTIKHPAVSAGALLGMSGGYYLSRLTDK